MIVKNKEFEFTTKPLFFDQNSRPPKPILKEQCIFLDIETVSGHKSYTELSPELQLRWKNKVDNWIKYSESSKAKILDAVFTEFEEGENTFDPKSLLDIYNKNKESNPEIQYQLVAGLYPEYGKIICSSFGFFNNGLFQTFSFVGSEHDLLANFQNALEKTNNSIVKQHGSCFVVGHNVQFFDIPYIAKRMSILGLCVPGFLHQPMLKPWEKKIIDTATEWRAGNTTGDATLETLCLLLGIQSPKDGITGKEMTEYYYSEKYDEQTVSDYCEGDCTAVKDLFVYLQNLKIVK